MGKYFKAKSGTGSSLRHQIEVEAATMTNRTGRSFHTTVRQSAINSANLGSSMNFEGTREYTIGSIMAGSAQSGAGE